MKYPLIISIFFTACSSGTPKENTAADSTTTQSSIVKDQLPLFDPAAYSVLDSAMGDLNLDEYPDKLLILKDTNERTELESARPLLILTGQPDKTFKLAARNDSVVLCAGCGGINGDPYQGITIKNGYFSVEHYGGSAWRWTRIITFKYSKQENTWYLHKDAGASYHTSDPDKEEEIVTNKEDFGKLVFTKYSNTKGS